jgi:hypothetical protein
MTAAEYNAKVIDEFRGHEGRVGGIWEGTPLLLLHHTGAKSGAHRVSPVGYPADESRYLSFASNGGAPRNRPGITTSGHTWRPKSRSGQTRSTSSPRRRRARRRNGCSDAEPGGSRTSPSKRARQIATSR